MKQDFTTYDTLVLIRLARVFHYYGTEEELERRAVKKELERRITELEDTNWDNLSEESSLRVSRLLEYAYEIRSERNDRRI